GLAATRPAGARAVPGAGPSAPAAAPVASTAWAPGSGATVPGRPPIPAIGLDAQVRPAGVTAARHLDVATDAGPVRSLPQGGPPPPTLITCAASWDGRNYTERLVVDAGGVGMGDDAWRGAR